MGRGKMLVAACAVAALASISSRANADATPLYQWSLNSPPNSPATSDLVTPDITPNNLSSDGGTLEMAISNGANTWTPSTSSTAAGVGTYTANGGGVSGLSGDYGINNSSTGVHGASSEGGVMTTNANVLTALPSLTQFTITAWVNPTATALGSGAGNLNRIFDIGATQTADGTSGIDGISLQMNGGKVEYVVNSQSAGAESFTTGTGVGNALIANDWNFVALEVNLQSGNIFFDSGIRSATGNAESDNTALYQYDANSNTGTFTSTGGYRSTNVGTLNTSNGTLLFGSDSNTAYATLLNNGTGSRAFAGLGDDFQIYNSLLTTQNLQDIIASDNPASIPEPSIVAGMALVSGTALLRRRRRTGAVNRLA
jgi:hypothetical protein